MRSPVTFWTLFAISLAAILTLWLPTITQSIATLSGEISRGMGSTSGTVEKELARSQEVLARAAEKFKEIQYASQSDSQAKLPESGVRTDKPEGVRDPEAALCSQRSGIVHTRTFESTRSYRVCIFPDGSECEVALFANDACHIGQYRNAEQGIVKKADLSITAGKDFYCDGKGVLAPPETATHRCMEDVAVKNIGFATSTQSFVYANTKFLAVGPLKPGESYQLSKQLKVLKESTIDLKADAKAQVDETREDNNSYTALIISPTP